MAADTDTVVLDPETAQALLRRAHARQDEPAALLTIGLQLLAGGQPAHAREVFCLGASVAPRHIAFDLGIGASHLAEDAFDLALLHVRCHLERFPDSAQGYFQLATALASTGDPGAMLEALVKSIRLDASNQQVLGFFYELHRRRGEADVAVACLERFSADLGVAGPRLFLARLAQDTGDVSRAGVYLDAALDDLDLSDPDALALASELLMAQDRADACIELLEDHQHELPFKSLLQLVLAYRRAGEDQLARAALRRLDDLAGCASERAEVRGVGAQLAV